MVEHVVSVVAARCAPVFVVAAPGQQLPDLPGGALTIAWGADNRITMTGPATESFRGDFDPADFGTA